MTKIDGKTASAAVKDILLRSPDGLREVIRALLREVLEAEMDEAGRVQERAHARAAGLPLRPLRPHPDHPDRQARTEGAAGPFGTFLHRTVRALPAIGTGTRRHPGRNVRAGRLDAEGEGDHRGAARPCLVGAYDPAIDSPLACKSLNLI
jgi:hypothetical protein